MKLHFAPKTSALASQIALEDVEADYQLVFVDVANGKQRSCSGPEFHQSAHRKPDVRLSTHPASTFQPTV